MPCRGEGSGEVEWAGFVALAGDGDGVGGVVEVFDADALGFLDAGAGVDKKGEGVEETGLEAPAGAEEHGDLFGGEVFEFFDGLGLCGFGSFDGFDGVGEAGVVVDGGEPVEVLLDGFGSEAAAGASIAARGLSEQPIAPSLDILGGEGVEVAGGAKEVDEPAVEGVAIDGVGIGAVVEASVVACYGVLGVAQVAGAVDGGLEVGDELSGGLLRLFLRRSFIESQGLVIPCSRMTESDAPLVSMDSEGEGFGLGRHGRLSRACSASVSSRARAISTRTWRLRGGLGCARAMKQARGGQRANKTRALWGMRGSDIKRKNLRVWR